jgi:hypothetical protein
VSTQQSLPGLSSTQRANKISKRASKQRRSKRVSLPVLPLSDSSFTPVDFVPATRAECPTTGLCVHVRCRFNLLRIDACDRAGRPGLASVPRDERGLTLPVSGDAGAERPGTTLQPRWLRIRGLQLEREVKVYVHPDLSLSEVRNGTLDYWLAHVHPGEPLLAYDTVTLGLGDEPLLLAQCELTADHHSVKFDRELPEYVINGSSALLLRRVRPVSSCALDEIDRHGPMSNEQVGDHIGRHRTLVARENKDALEHGIANAAKMGMSKGEFLAGLRELSAK